MGGIQPAQAVKLNVALHGEPLASSTFVKGAAGEWTFEQDTFSVGLEIDHEYNFKHFYVGSRIVLDSNNSGTSVAGTGVAIEAGVEAGRVICVKYKSVIYWDQSGDYGYGKLCYTRPSHRITVDLRVPILGGSPKCSNDSESYSH